jgi:NHLM bacteriocin system ABC transporter ATP-binding protein
MTTERASTILLEDPSSVVLVVAGRVDVFAIPRVDGHSNGNGAPPGPRRHLWTATAGATLFGLDVTHATATLLAVVSSDTTLRTERLDDLVAHGRTPGGVPATATVIDGFLEGIGSAVASRAMPAVHAAIEPYHSEALRAGQRISAAGAPVWLRVERGSAAFAGDDRLLVDRTSSLVPMAAGAWLEAREDLQVAAEDTASLLEANESEAWQSLRAASALFLRWVERTLDSEDAAEVAALRRKADADAALRSGGLARLAGILGRSAKLPAGDDDLLMSTLRTIGRASSIEFRPAPKWESTVRTSDPVDAICRASRVRHRQVGLRGAWWQSDGGPLLAFTKDDHRPVSLLPRRGGGYERVDAAAGTRSRVTPASVSQIEPVAYTFSVPAPQRSLTTLDLLELAFGDLRAEAWLVFGLALGGALLGLAVPIATQFMFGSIIPNAGVGDVVVLMLSLIAVNVGQTLFELLKAFALLRLEGKSQSTLQAAVIDRLLALPVWFFRKYTVGELASRAGGINALRDLFSGVAINSILGGTFAFVYLALLVVYAWKLALVAVALAVVVATVTAVCGVRLIRLRRDEQEAAGKIWGLVFQLLTGIAKLRVSGSEGRGFAQWSGRFADQKRLAVRAGALQNVVQVFNAMLPLSATAILFFFVGGIHDGTGTPALSTAEFIAFSSAFGTFLRAGVSLSTTAVQLLAAVPIMERARPILDVAPEAPADRPDPGELTGRIEIAHVSFRYAADGPLVLDDVSISAHQGEFIAIVGPSGSGKSTLLRLLLGFETPGTGSVAYDGQDLSTVDLTAVRAQLGVVLQNGRIMAGDLFHNIVGSAPLTVEDAWSAATQAGLEDDIKAMPMGIHTVMSEGGTTLSGGQRQRLLIARAIVHRPRIMLFDEATSALDNRAQDLVTESLARIRSTRIVVAHRLSTIRNADRIYVLDGGRLVQHGTFDELVAEEGMFERLVRPQFV